MEKKEKKDVARTLANSSSPTQESFHMPPLKVNSSKGFNAVVPAHQFMHIEVSD